ncbi:MAG TPA: GxxExxY protein [Anaerolineales bacterium]|nr:GxxExxY protein [Anaerolineales bacterium]
MTTNIPNSTNRARKLVGPDVLFSELSYRIMEAVFEVHNRLGPGFSEQVYQRALIAEFEIREIPFEAEKNINVLYREKVIGNYRLDLLVDGKIIMELKAVDSLNDLFKQQLNSYLKATGMRLGILINFGSRRVEYVRIVN